MTSLEATTTTTIIEITMITVGTEVEEVMTEIIVNIITIERAIELKRVKTMREKSQVMRIFQVFLPKKWVNH